VFGILAVERFGPQNGNRDRHRQAATTDGNRKRQKGDELNEIIPTSTESFIIPNSPCASSIEELTLIDRYFLFNTPDEKMLNEKE
jgi:hypothetical protein